MNNYKNTKIVYQTLDKSYSIKLNTIKISSANSLSHEIAKCVLALELLYSGKTILTECIFLNKKRADILAFGSNDNDITIYEVTHSEKEGGDGSKDLDYPFNIIYLSSEKILNSKYLKSIIEGKTK